MIFDVCGALPEGTTVLEASAGTGKTFTIAALAARYVAEGRASLHELLLVTFGRSATAELRQRVRERLVSAERGLADPAAARAGGDTVLALLAGAPDDEVARRRRRLTAAVADFDAATIATTHQFCHQVLAGLGLAADADPGAVFTDDADDLVVEVADDLYLRKYARPGAPAAGLSRAGALTVARAAVADGQARLEPVGAAADSPAGVRHRFAAAVRREVAARRRRQRLYGYDDMLTDLAAVLTDPERGPDACRRLRERYRVVLIDEFQDTDPVQWTVVRTAFHGHATLVLIGDPKQAIYAFRGADVASYLAAAGEAPRRATLGTNWRSDAPVLDAFATVLGRAALGDSRITVRPVGAAHAGSRLRGAPVGAALRLRVVGRAGAARGRNGLIPAAAAREIIVADAAADIVRLLESGARLDRGELVPGDVAVLVRSHRQSTLIHEALTARGVPAVLGGTTSVFGTVAARDWQALLDALDQPHRSTRVAGAARTGLVGWTTDRLAAAGEDDFDELAATLRTWSRLLADRGVAALLEAVTAAGMPARLLTRRSGERYLTDVRHVGAALHAAAAEGGLGPAAIAEWLRRRVDEAPRDVSLERSRRLESDEDAVQILTVHGSKGLEYPVVYLPFAADRYVGKPDLLSLHDDAGARVLDVGGPTGPDFGRHRIRHQDEEAGEDLRLLYVALTRAACQVVTWWAPTANARSSALHRFLAGRPGDGETPAAAYPVPDTDADAFDRLSRLAGPHLTVEPVVTPAPAGRWTPPAAARPDLAAATFARRLDTGWRRTSYSRITAAAHDGPGVGSEPDTGEIDDESLPVPDAEPGDQPAGPPSPMAALPTGAAFGTLLHAMLEDTDLTAPDLLGTLTGKARDLLARTPIDVDPAELATALLPALHTPLGPLADDRPLTMIGPADRLDELDFELPLDGGDTPDTSDPHGRTPVVPATIADCLDRHLAPGDPLAGYAARLRAPGLGDQPLRGYLTGSIDAVLRLPGPRYVVVDYKSNWLGGYGADGPLPLTAGDYRPAALAGAMSAAHYPLQALLYAVALHRYLRWRQPRYDPSVHLGGVLYLFLRGMCGPETPRAAGVPYGVFSWHPPAALVTDLSRILDGGRP